MAAAVPGRVRPRGPSLDRCCPATGGPALLGPDACASFRSAGAVWNLDRVAAPVPEVSVPSGQHPRAPKLVVHRSKALCAHRVTERSGFRVTSPARTIVDLAAVLDQGALEIALESARRRRLVTVAAVRQELGAVAGRGRAGAPSLRQLLDNLQGEPATASVLEVRAARLLRDSGLPPPRRQYPVVLGGRHYRLDFAWPSQRVALETDGRAYHGDADFDRDRMRWSDFATGGWRLLIATWADVTRASDHLLHKLELALAA